MADYISSIKHGLDAAARAVREKAEIQRVLSELNIQLSQATEDKLQVGLYEFSGSGKSDRTNALLRFLSIEKHKGIGLAHKRYGNELPVAELAAWKQETDGYPCELIFGTNRIACGDSLGLEKALKTLFSDPNIGGKIYEFLNYVPKQATPSIGDKETTPVATRSLKMGGRGTSVKVTVPVGVKKGVATSAKKTTPKKISSAASEKGRQSSATKVRVVAAKKLST